MGEKVCGGVSVWGEWESECVWEREKCGRERCG